MGNSYLLFGGSENLYSYHGNQGVISQEAGNRPTSSSSFITLGTQRTPHTSRDTCTHPCSLLPDSQEIGTGNILDIYQLMNG